MGWIKSSVIDAQTRTVCEEEGRRVVGGEDEVVERKEEGVLGLGSGKSRILLWEDIWWS